MSEPKLSATVRPFVVGIPTYNRYDLLDECIASVLANSVVPVKIVVIDNGGNYRPTSERVEVVRPCRNLGVAAVSPFEAERSLPNNNGLMVLKKRE